MVTGLFKPSYAAPLFRPFLQYEGFGSFRLVFLLFIIKDPTVKPSCPGHRPQSVNTDCLPRLGDSVLKIEVTVSGQGGT